MSLPETIPPAIFEARLSPRGSLSRAALLMIVAVIAVTAALLAVILLRLGLWPIVPFLVLTAVVTMLALWLNQRRQGRTEHLHIDPAGVTITIDQRSKPQSVRHMPLYGLTMEREIDPDYGVRALRLSLRGSAIEIAGQLAPSERAALADRLETSLRDAHCQLWQRNTILPARHHSPPQTGP